MHRQRAREGLLALCLALSSSAGCAVDDFERTPELALEGDAALASPTRAVAAVAPECGAHIEEAVDGDPSAVIANSWCCDDYQWDGTRGRLYWPMGASCAQSIYSPLVVLLRGNGFFEDDYDYLAGHLARNGYIVASVDVQSATNSSAADFRAAAREALDFVYDYVWSRWSRRFYLDPSAVAIVGHSRGGETARYLAAALADHPLFDVRALVGLAPTGVLNEFVDGTEAPASMLLYGTLDHDVPPRQVFRHYDRAGTDASQFDPDLNALAIYKSLKLFAGGTHGGFSDRGAFEAASQRETARGYVLAYLHAHLRNDFRWYEDYVRGDDVPGTYSSDIYSQYRDGIHRRVIESFTDANLLQSNIGGTVTSLNAALSHAQLSQLPSPHETRAGRVVPQRSELSRVSFALPAGRRDLRSFEVLSLRIGAASTDPPPRDVFVTLVQDGVALPAVRLSSHGSIASMVRMCTGGADSCLSGENFIHLSTIRVPLAAFAERDNVSEVRLVFGPDAVGRELIFDDLEAAQFSVGR